MTYQYTTSALKTDYVHDVISVTRVGTHTYEFWQHGRSGKLRVVDVIALSCDVRCLCHHR